MTATIEIVGQRFGRLTAIARRGSDDGKAAWVCRCDCGAEVRTVGKHLRSGQTRSCGCLQRERTVAALLKHGAARHGHKSPEYLTWCGMKSRCSIPTDTNYPKYGARGIRVCQRWMDSFAAFYADMGTRPSPKHSIDRFPNNDGNYEPNNCRWATASQQMRNRRPWKKSRSPAHTLGAQ